MIDKLLCARRYRSGLSLRQLAKEFGVSFQSVHTCLVKLGVKMRPVYITRRASSYTGLKSPYNKRPKDTPDGSE